MERNIFFLIVFCVIFSSGFFYYQVPLLLESNYDWHIARGLQYFNSNQNEKASLEYEKAKSHGDLDIPLLYQAGILIKIHDFDSAEELLAQVKNTERYSYHYLQGKLLRERDQLNQSVFHLEKSLAMSFDEPIETDYKGTISKLKKKWRVQTEHSDKLYFIVPAYNELGMSYLKMQNRDSAKHSFEHSLAVLATIPEPTYLRDRLKDIAEAGVTSSEEIMR